MNHYREVGLWYGILTVSYNLQLFLVMKVEMSFPKAVYAGLHAIFVPSPVVAAQPIAWIHMITRNKGRSRSIYSPLLIKKTPAVFS